MHDLTRIDRVIEKYPVDILARLASDLDPFIIEDSTDEFIQVGVLREESMRAVVGAEFELSFFDHVGACEAADLALLFRDYEILIRPQEFHCSGESCGTCADNECFGLLFGLLVAHS